MKAISRNFALVLGYGHGFAGMAMLRVRSCLRQQDAESRICFRDEPRQIVATAKKEGRMRAISFLSGKMLDAMVRAFRAKYPFLDVHVEEQGGSVEAAQRFLLEIKAGIVKDWDANRLWTELYDEYLPHQKKFDILGMAQNKVLNIPPMMVDPVHRHVVALSSNLPCVGLQQNDPPEKVPVSGGSLAA